MKRIGTQTFHHPSQTTGGSLSYHRPGSAPIETFDGVQRSPAAWYSGIALPETYQVPEYTFQIWPDCRD